MIARILRRESGEVNSKCGYFRWQLPDAFVFVDAIPRTSVGKFKKIALRERFADWEWE